MVWDWSQAELNGEVHFRPMRILSTRYLAKMKILMIEASDFQFSHAQFCIVVFALALASYPAFTETCLASALCQRTLLAVKQQVRFRCTDTLHRNLADMRVVVHMPFVWCLAAFRVSVCKHNIMYVKGSPNYAVCLIMNQSI